MAIVSSNKMNRRWIALWLLLTFFDICFTLDQKEIDALKEIKKRWNVSDWPGNPNCTTWSRHLSCNDQLHVISLDIGFATPELLSSSIPEAICDLSFLEQLKLYGNRLSGAIPRCIGGLVHLRYLDLSGNCLGGKIPESLGNLTEMEYFDLSVNHHNEFSFTHRELCNKSTLSNGLTGAIPSSLGKMKKVKYFYLSGNQLSGSIPSSLGNLSSAMYIYINANNISGSLPPSIGKLQNLQDLQLNKNQISGEIPREIGNCSSLRIIQINRNNLSGEIPDTIGDLAQLQALELLSNGLQGRIPEFKTTPVLDLNLFDVRNNNLSGPLPKSFKDAPLRYLLVSNNTHLQGIDYKLPDYIRPDNTSRSVVDQKRHYDCPGFVILSRAFQVTAPLIQLDPEYYNYTLCNCRPGFFGLPPNTCRPCLKYGNCQSLTSSMTFHRGVFPITDKANVRGLVECSWVDESFSPCNPNDNCFYGKYGLQGISGNCTLCSQNYEGRLCCKCSCTASACSYHFHNECIPCKKISTKTVALYSLATIFTLALFAFFHNSSMMRLLLIIILVSLILALDSGSWFYLNILIIFIVLIPATSNGLSSGLVKSLIFYLQTTAALFPPFLSRWLSRLFSRVSFSNVKFVGVVCIFPQALGISKYAILNRFVFSLCAPLMVFLAVLLFLLFKKVILFCRKAFFHSPIQADTSIRRQVFFTIIFIAYFSFFNASTLVISVLSCSKDPSGYEYMNAQSYKAVRCHSSLWHYMLIAAAVGTFFLVILPLLLFTILLFRNRRSLDDPDLSSWLGYLYMSYRPKDDAGNSRPREILWCYCEVLYMVFRFALAASLSIPSNQSIWKPTLSALLLIAVLPVFLGFKPYTRNLDNYAAFTSVLSLIFTLFVSVQIQDNAADQDFTIHEFLILTVNGLTVLMFFMLIVWCGRDELRRNAYNIKESVHYFYMRAKQYKNRISNANQEVYLNNSDQE